MSRLTLSRVLSNDSLSDDKVLQYPWPRFTPKRSRKSRTWSADFWDVLPSCQGMLGEWLNGQFAKEAKHSNVPLETIYKLWKLFINHIQKDSFYYEISQRAGSKIEPWKQKVQQMLWVLGPLLEVGHEAPIPYCSPQTYDTPQFLALLTWKWTYPAKNWSSSKPKCPFRLHQSYVSWPSARTPAFLFVACRI